MIKDSHNLISGKVSTFTGKSTKDGIVPNVSFNHPIGITMNELTGDIYVSGTHVIGKISPQGTLQCKSPHLFINFSTTNQGQVTTIAGCGKQGFADGQGQSAMFSSPQSICFSQFHDCLFVCDYLNNRIRIIELKTGI